MKPDEQKIEKHPSYGTILVNTISGQGYLFGSNAQHHSFVGITIMEAEMRRDLSHDWTYGTKELIEIWMTEAQWAHFISSFGNGSGTPVTLRHVEGRRRPMPPEPAPKALEFKAEVREHLQRAFDNLTGVLTAIDTALQPGSKSLSKTELKALSSSLTTAKYDISSNLDYVMGQFHAQVEKDLSAAKIEAEAYFNRRLAELGVRAAQTAHMLDQNIRDASASAPALEEGNHE